MNNIVQGLEVSVLGILITFTALGVFILIMIVLQRLFPSAQTEAPAPAQTEMEEQPLVEVKTRKKFDTKRSISASGQMVQRKTRWEINWKDKTGYRKILKSSFSIIIA